MRKKQPTFSFSNAALAQIALLKGYHLAQTPHDPPVMPGLSFGWFGNSTDANPPLRPCVGFWCASEFPASARNEVEVVSGIEVVPFMPAADRARLNGMVVDYSPEQAFYVRKA